MKIAPGFEVVNIANDYLLVPLGEQMDKFNGTVILNEVSAFILNQLKAELTKEELVRLLMNEYDVSLETAQADVDKAVEQMKEIGIIHESSSN